MKRKQAKEATRRRLLESAESAFVRSDFKASTLEIAEESGVAHGTLFFHFKSRDELILAVVRELVERITGKLFRAYKSSKSLKGFLTVHFETVRANWPLLRALFSGYAGFSEATRTEITCLLAVANYYLVQAFHRWTDYPLERAVLWQGALTYMSFFGDVMLDKKKVSGEFIDNVMSFLQKSVREEDARKIPEDRTIERDLCISCGEILRSVDDRAGGDETSRYCRACGRDDGTLRPFDEVLEIMTRFIQNTQILNKRAAREAAWAVLSKNPAWKDHVEDIRGSRAFGS
jgi:AcrR family transcriptional regulator